MRFALKICFPIWILGSLQAEVQAEERKSSFAKSAGGFFKRYLEATDPEDKIKAEYNLASVLKKEELFYSASKFYSRIIRRGNSGNKYFDKSLADLSEINAEAAVGHAQIAKLFTNNIDSERITKTGSGFYFYFKGFEQFSRAQYKSAEDNFLHVTTASDYYLKTLFHLGIIAALSGQGDRGIEHFKQVLQGEAKKNDSSPTWLGELANLNIARIYYEKKQFADSIKFYAQIPRESDNWLQAVFEASWAFFLMERPNNALGNIHTLHSPFFAKRFYPESYVLQSLTFLRMCLFDRAKISLDDFHKRYDPVLGDLQNLLKIAETDPERYFHIIYSYRTKQLTEYVNAWEILDALSRTDTYKQAASTVINADAELVSLKEAPATWLKVGLTSDLEKFLVKKKKLAIRDAGRRLYIQTQHYQQYLVNLVEQTKLIHAELLLGKVDSLRQKLNIKTEQKAGNFIGGMKPLDIAQELEYWPFEGEYWEDELGSYVFNVQSKCSG